VYVYVFYRILSYFIVMTDISDIKKFMEEYDTVLFRTAYQIADLYSVAHQEHMSRDEFFDHDYDYKHMSKEEKIKTKEDKMFRVWHDMHTGLNEWRVHRKEMINCATEMFLKYVKQLRYPMTEDHMYNIILSAYYIAWQFYLGHDIRIRFQDLEKELRVSKEDVKKSSAITRDMLRVLDYRVCPETRGVSSSSQVDELSNQQINAYFNNQPKFSKRI